MGLLDKFYPIGILLLIIIGFGIWVSRSGKPYNGLLFNIHKLVALGAVILTGIRLFRLDPLSTFPIMVILLIAMAGLSVIAMFATGAVLSIQEELNPLMQWIHGVSAVVISLCFIMALLLLLS